MTGVAYPYNQETSSEWTESHVRDTGHQIMRSSESQGNNSDKATLKDSRRDTIRGYQKESSVKEVAVEKK